MSTSCDADNADRPHLRGEREKHRAGSQEVLLALHSAVCRSPGPVNLSLSPSPSSCRVWQRRVLPGRVPGLLLLTQCPPWVKVRLSGGVKGMSSCGAPEVGRQGGAGGVREVPSRIQS